MREWDHHRERTEELRTPFGQQLLEARQFEAR